MLSSEVARSVPDFLWDNKEKIQSDNNTGIAILGGPVFLELNHLLPAQVGRERGLGCLS